MKESLLALVVCPECRTSFRLQKEDGAKGEIVAGDLECTRCGVRYPIIDGIPRILDEGERADNYSRNFQYYWLNMNWHRPEFNKRRFYELTEWRPADIRGRRVLEAGCGGGRWLYQFAEEGASEIVAFDYTLAVERARELCSRFSNIHYVQADIFKIPFLYDHFDITHCHGVLMATPDPRRGVERLGSTVKPGGELAVLLYRNLTRPQKVIDDVLCGVTKRLPTKVAFYLTAIPSLVEYVPGVVPLLENVVHLSGQPDFTLKHLHNFDWYTCTYRHRNSPAEAKQWLRDFGFSDVRILNTNEFRVRSTFDRVRRFKESMLERGYFLKATLGLRARKIGRSGRPPDVGRG